MSITWNGVSSDTIGVIVERIPNRYVPTRRFSPQQVAGRNGNILLVDKAFPNVEQEYEVYLSAESQGLPSVARACAEWLMGPDGYCRLTDSYDTTVYREAFLMGGFDIENILNKFGRCTITFSCKPQKYLLTGDTPIEIPDGTTTTYTGDVVQFDVITGASITSLSATITPTQDLHGYENPWPAGGGKNKYSGGDVIVSNTLFANVPIDPIPAGTYTVSAVIGTAVTTCRVAFRKQDSSALEAVNIPYVSGCRSYATITLPDTAYRIYFYYAGSTFGTGDQTYTDIQIESGSSPTSFATYSNICPISGLTGLSVYRTGKNLFNKNATDQNAAHALSPSTATEYSAGSYTVTGFIKVKEGVKYITSGTGGSNDVCFYDESKALLSGSANFSEARTAPTGAVWLKFDYQTANADTVQLEEGSTATAYEPYQGTTYAVDWTTEAGTVYGGTLDVVTGVLAITHKGFVFDGTENLTAAGNGGITAVYKFATNADKIVYTDSPQTKKSDYKCSHYKWSGYMYAPSFSDIRVGTGANAASNERLTFMNALIGRTLTQFKQYLTDQYNAGTPVTVYAPLATPLTYQLTPQEIQALVGTNNVWSSSGDVSVTVTTPLGGTVTNPTPFEARPLLEVSGVGEITINGKPIQILESVSDFEIDCETMEAEDNSKIYCMDFPELSGGENEIVGDGSITALTVTPRWWTL